MQKETTDTWASIRDFSNLRFIESRMPNELQALLNLEIAKLSNDSERYNHNLQGHIEEEYALKELFKIINKTKTEVKT